MMSQIVDASISTDSMKYCAYHLMKANCPKLLAVLEVPIFRDPLIRSSWNCFVDVRTGEIVAVEHLFICD